MSTQMDWHEIAHWIRCSDRVFIKKLSRNDCSWADDPKNKHQGGFYIPREIRDAGFFPELSNATTSADHIYESYFSIFWPASREICRARNVHYSNKGPESHITNVPPDHFSMLSPASMLIIGILGAPIRLDETGIILRSSRINRALTPPTEPANYWCIVVDSVSDEAEIIDNAFSLTSDFHFDLFPPEMASYAIDEEAILIAEISAALREGTLESYISRQSFPRAEELAEKAQALWLEQNGKPSLDPFTIDSPGDAVMRISRDIEYALYKRAELRQRAAQAANLLLRGQDPVAALVRGFGQLDALFLSAAQTRKSRAGRSFEQHVQRLLADGRVRHEAQAVLGGRRPDFVLPDVATLNRAEDRDTLILSLKTTLRERWKQLGLERPHAPVFLATVDDRVSAEAIADMGRHAIMLVVPETLKASRETCYREAAGVITFRQFFDEEIRANRPALLLAG